MQPGSYAVELLGSIGFFLVFFSYLFRSMLYLRLISILAAIIGIIYFAYIAEQPLWTAIFWQVSYIVVNLIQIIQLILDNSVIGLNRLEKKIYYLGFKKMRVGSFKRLMKLVEFREVDNDKIILQQNEKVTHLMFIYQGTVDIVADGHKTAECHAGSFIGEMSFETKKPATASVIARSNVKYIQWKKSELNNLLATDNQLDSELHAAIIFDLIEKIMHQNSESIARDA
jgi:CRP-like cAMP-binding protein